MSKGTGIDISKETFGKWQSILEDDKIRFIQLGLEKETFIITQTVEKTGDWKEDFSLIPDLLDDTKPCYIVYRKNKPSHWIFMHYIPSSATVRNRMIFASSRDTAKESLGAEYITDLYFGSVKVDFCYEDFHMATQNIDDTLAMSNEEIDNRNDMLEDLAPKISISNSIHTVQFPLSDKASENLKSFSSASGASNNLLILETTKSETIEFVEMCSTSFSEISSHLTSERPAYVFYRFNHTYKEEDFAPIIFYHWCPDSAPIRIKMVFSTVVSYVTQKASSFGVEITRRIEVTEQSDISEKDLLLVLHPEKSNKKLFSKPKAPGMSSSRPRSRRSRKS